MADDNSLAPNVVTLMRSEFEKFLSIVAADPTNPEYKGWSTTELCGWITLTLPNWKQNRTALFQLVHTDIRMFPITHNDPSVSEIQNV